MPGWSGRETKREFKARVKAHNSTALKYRKERVTREIEELGKYMAGEVKDSLPVAPGEDDVEFWDKFFSLIESGQTTGKIASDKGISLSSLRTRLRKSSLKSRLKDAYELRGIYHVEQIEDRLQEMLDGEIEPHVAKVDIEARRWIASKFNTRIFGDKQQVDVKVTDMTRAYVEQLQALEKPKKPKKPKVVNGVKELVE